MTTQIADAAVKLVLQWRQCCMTMICRHELETRSLATSGRSFTEWRAVQWRVRVERI